MSTKKLLAGLVVTMFFVFGIGTASAADLSYSRANTGAEVARMGIRIAAEDLNIAINLMHDRFGAASWNSVPDFGSLDQDLSYSEIMKLLDEGMRYYQMAVENYQEGYYKLSYSSAAKADQHFLTVINSFK
jgi:hypothetical protein